MQTFSTKLPCFCKQSKRGFGCCLVSGLAEVSQGLRSSGALLNREMLSIMKNLTRKSMLIWKSMGKKKKGVSRDFENFSCKFSQIIKLRVKRHQYPLSILFPVHRIPISWTAFAIFPSPFWQMPAPSPFVKERDSQYDKIIPSYVTCITILLRGCLQNWRLALTILFLQNFHISVARNWRRKKRQFNFPWETTMQFFRKYWSLPSTFCITV